MNRKPPAGLVVQKSSCIDLKCGRALAHCLEFKTKISLPKLGRLIIIYLFFVKMGLVMPFFREFVAFAFSYILGKRQKTSCPCGGEDVQDGLLAKCRAHCYGLVKCEGEGLWGPYRPAPATVPG